MAWSLTFLLVAMLSIQFGATTAKQLFPIAGAAGTTVLRTLFAAILLSIIWRPWRGPISRQSVKALAAYGISLGFMNLLFYLALQRIPLGIAVTLEFIGPLAISLLSSKKVTDILWAILAGLGIWLILPNNLMIETLDLEGVLLAMGAGVFWAFYIIFGQRAGRDFHSGRAAAIGMCFAALVVFPFGVYESGKILLEPKIWLWGLFIAILSSAIPYSLEMLALKNIPRKTFGILMSLEPVVAAMMGFLFLSETLSPVQGLAILCVIIASVGSTSSARKQSLNI